MPPPAQPHVRLAKRTPGGILPAMTDWQSDPATLRAVQEEIYRGKVLRARSLTETQRLDEALELSNGIYGSPGSADEEARWDEVERRLRILRRLHEHNLYFPVEAA